MKTSLRAVQELWDEIENGGLGSDPIFSCDPTLEAQHRATVIFDWLLTVLASPDSPCSTSIMPK